VYLAPGEVTWIDVIIPRDDPLWSDDVGRAMWWLGEAWSATLADLGVSGRSVHRGGLVTTPWSATVCFAGLGPGEVLIGEHKAVGISQRRTRDAARFQCALYRVWRPEALIELLADLPALPGELPAVAVVDQPTDVVVDAFVAHLP
jgi:lipoate---protein ligase